MTFKMRSGNKVSFKNMGSSPAKQNVDDGLGGADPQQTRTYKEEKARKLKIENDAAVLAFEKAEKARLYAESPEGKAKTADEEFEKKGAYSGKNREGNINKDLKAKNIRKEKESRDLADDGILNNSAEDMYEGTSETDYDTDLLAYKSKEQLAQDKESRRIAQKSNQSSSESIFSMGGGVGDKQYTKAEKEADKDIELQDRLRREKGTGGNRLKFDWGKMFLGGDLASGTSWGAKHESTQKKIDKRTKKEASRITSGKGTQNRINQLTTTLADLNQGEEGSIERIEYNRVKKMLDKQKKNQSKTQKKRKKQGY